MFGKSILAQLFWDLSISDLMPPLIWQEVLFFFLPSYVLHRGTTVRWVAELNNWSIFLLWILGLHLGDIKRI